MKPIDGTFGWAQSSSSWDVSVAVTQLMIDATQMMVPLLTKAIIDNIVQARSAGEGVRPSSDTVGLACGLLALMVFGQLCITQSDRLANVLGHQTRGAVR